jgi:signal peptidase
VAAAAVVVLGLLAVTVGPKFLPYQALVVRSGSMAPTIPTGSIVFYNKVKAADVKVGQVIVFNRPGEPNEKVTHRVYKIGTGPTGRYFVTKGDANGVPDDWQVPAVGTGWVAKFHIPSLGYALADLQSTTARLLLLLIPALLLGLITLYEIWRDRGGGAKA